jgi:hypothetical protein
MGLPEENEMGQYEDVMMVEGVEGYETADEMQEAMAMQRMINDGNWALQGSFGRAMMDAIKGGYCLLGKNGARDYYGNYIPSRDQVEAGTKGSYDYVVQAMGAEWADAMAGAE